MDAKPLVRHDVQLLRAEFLSRDEISLRVGRGLKNLLFRRSPTQWLDFGWTFDKVASYFDENGLQFTIHEGYDLGVASTGKVLGACNPLDGTIAIDPVVGPASNNPKRTFVQFHELVGHLWLQGEFLRRQCRDREPGFLVDTEFSISPEDREWLEWQANYAAGCAAAPKPLVIAACRRSFKRAMPYRGPGRYGVAGAQLEILDKRDLATAMAAVIQPSFGGLSIEALGLRIVQCGQIVQLHSGPKLFLHRTAAWPSLRHSGARAAG